MGTRERLRKWLRSTGILGMGIMMTAAVKCGAAPVRIDESLFPDEFLRTALLEYDVDGDEILSEDEQKNMESLDLDSYFNADNQEMELTDARGLEYFPYLEELKIRSSKIHFLDLKRNTSLSGLRIICENLDTLDLSKNRQLRSLSLTAAGMKALDLSAQTELKDLVADIPGLKELRISSCKKLIYLDLRTDSLSSLSLNGYKKLEELNIESSNMQLNVKNLTGLRDLDIRDPGMELDLRNLNSSKLYCVLGSLNVKKLILGKVSSVHGGLSDECEGPQRLYFSSDMPKFDKNCMKSRDEDDWESEYPGSMTIYFPYNNRTWKADQLLDYGGIITWKAWDPKTGKEKKIVKRQSPGTTFLDEKTGGSYQIAKDGALIYTAPKEAYVSNIRIPDFVIRLGVKYPVRYLKGESFQNNTNLKKLIIGNQVTNIGHYAFYGCKKLSSVSFGRKVKYISRYAFAGCTSLKKITLPSGVDTIGHHTFYGCKKLNKIVLKTGRLKAGSIGTQAFLKTGKKPSVSVPPACLSRYKTLLAGAGLSGGAKYRKN